LTSEERDALAVCEAIIDDGLRTFIEVGTALATIRDRQLYRATHGTFANYAQQRYRLSRSHAHRMINAAAVVHVTDDIENEAQARELLPLLGEPERLRQIVERARERGHGELTAANLRAERRVLEQQRSGSDAPAARPPRERIRGLTRQVLELLSILALLLHDTSAGDALSRLLSGESSLSDVVAELQGGAS
jgi:hypothetical protein